MNESQTPPENGESNPNHPPPSSVLFFGSRFISRTAKTENPVPRSFFPPQTLAARTTSGTTGTVNGDRGKKANS